MPTLHLAVLRGPYSVVSWGRVSTETNAKKKKKIPWPRTFWPKTSWPGRHNSIINKQGLLAARSSRRLRGALAASGAKVCGNWPTAHRPQLGRWEEAPGAAGRCFVRLNIQRIRYPVTRQ
jgi:hypothetical protein